MHDTKNPTLDCLTIQEPIVMDLPYGADEDGGIHWSPADLADLWAMIPASKTEQAEIIAYLEDVATDNV